MTVALFGRRNANKNVLRDQFKAFYVSWSGFGQLVVF